MSMKRVIITGALTAALSFSANVFAGDIESGKAKSTTCAACHGQNGISQIPIYPNLAGQKEQYLASSLKAYKDKQRNGGQAVIMQGQTANLSEQDIADLAAYYSSLPANDNKTLKRPLFMSGFLLKNKSSSVIMDTLMEACVFATIWRDSRAT